MNGETMAIPQIKIANPVIELIENLLMAARQGQVSSLSIIAIAPSGGMMRAHVGGQLGDLTVGTVLMQRSLAEAIENLQKQPARPGIIRPALGGI